MKRLSSSSLASIALIGLLLVLASPTFAADSREPGANVRAAQDSVRVVSNSPSAPMEVVIADVSFGQCQAAATIACGSFGNVQDFDHRSGFLGIGSRCSFACD